MNKWHNNIRLAVLLFDNRYLNAWYEYWYETDELENGIVLPIKLKSVQ